ncbi:hypothetical protein BSKO_11123 [Bryopsis sp. KO-2023]|nr:hypothetical protein BSKO_11123 [Bryopsis sp. KO-2023]
MRFVVSTLCCGFLLLATTFSFAAAVRVGNWDSQNLGKKNATLGGDNDSDGFSQGAMQGLAMILVSEMGDETFIIAAILAMRHPKTVIFTGAIAALALMTVISAALGVVVPALISPELTHHAATILYTIFGFRLLYVAWKADPNETQEEIKEVEEKLSETHKSSSPYKRFFQKLCTPILLEAFILTFLAEWGDRSQIATITLAAHLNPVGVTVGAIVGHIACTGLAVVGGELVARKISQRTAAIAGSVLFFAFAVHNLMTS